MDLRELQAEYLRQQRFGFLNDADREGIFDILETSDIFSTKQKNDAFFKMTGILGKPRAGFSWDELREEAIHEKYGV